MSKLARPVEDGPELTKEIKAARAKCLEYVADQSLNDALLTLNAQLDTLDGRTQRLGNLAAQTWIVRKRFQSVIAGREETVRQSLLLKAAGGGAPVTKISAAEAKELLKKKMKLRGNDEKPKSDETSDWVRIRMAKEAEVNGMVFFENSVLQVKRADVQTLLDEKIAEIIDADDTAQPAKDTADAEVNETVEPTGSDESDTGETPAVSDEKETPAP